MFVILQSLSEEVERVSVYTQTIEPVVVAFTQTVDTTDHEQQTSQATDLDPHVVHQLHMVCVYAYYSCNLTFIPDSFIFESAVYQLFK